MFTWRIHGDLIRCCPTTDTGITSSMQKQDSVMQTEPVQVYRGIMRMPLGQDQGHHCPLPLQFDRMIDRKGRSHGN
jgi:hypothetical protein